MHTMKYLEPASAKRHAPIKQFYGINNRYRDKDNYHLDCVDDESDYIPPVEYVGQEWERSLDISPKIPAAGPGQKVVSDVEEIIVNGKRVTRICYRVIIDKTEKD